MCKHEIAAPAARDQESTSASLKKFPFLPNILRSMALLMKEMLPSHDNVLITIFIEVGVEKIIWDASYSIGVPQLDAQHKKLIAMINALMETPAAEYSSDIISELLSNAINYALEHFKSEEDYMEAINYPGIVAHKKEHKRFILKMANESVLVMQKKEGPTDLLMYLKTWLSHHILYSDMKYMKFHAKRLADQKISLQLLARVS